MNSVRMTSEDVQSISSTSPVSFDTPNVRNIQDVLDKPDVHKKEGTMLSKMGHMIQGVAPMLVERAVQMAIAAI